MRIASLAVGWLILTSLPAYAVDKTVIERAADRGVAALKAMQQSNGTWNFGEIGATALAALALLECDVPKNDRSIVAATKAIRDAAVTETKTYSVALCILYLDRLDEPFDTPVIESLVVRLLAGQRNDGGWGYYCPGLPADEVKRIRAEMDPSRDLRAGRDLGKLPAKGKRSTDDLPKAVLDQLKGVERLVDSDRPQSLTSDNSNTQFACLGLWVGRRYGVPTQAALIRCADRFRVTQNRDGGWSYMGRIGGGELMGIGGSSPTMTCAGMFALAAGQGAVFDVKKSKDPKLEKLDISKDVNMNAGLVAMSSVVGVPVGWNGVPPRHPAVSGASGKAFYFLWSLERAAVALNLETIGKKDWYNWGAEILLANQNLDGTWRGEYAGSGADTSFALLFLKRANLARDLSGVLRTPKGGGAARVLKGGMPLRASGDLPGIGIGEKGKKEADEGSADVENTRPRLEVPRPRATTADEKAAVNVGDALLKASAAERDALLKQLRDNKGAVNTETLVWVITRLTGDGQRQARIALAERFTRLTDTSLRSYLKDEEPEIRRAACLAAAARGSKVLVPELIGGLNDSDDFVRRAAHTALKELTRQDFGPSVDASESQRKSAIAAWEKWWKENSRE